MTDAILMLSGAIALGWLLAGLFFLRFWRQTKDVFFLYFAAAFWLEACNRIIAAVLLSSAEDEPLLYVLRLAAYGLVIIAIWNKNRPREERSGPESR